jgi:hypothetical protein
MVAKGFTELIFCGDIPLHPGNEQDIYYSVRNARLALACTAAFFFALRQQGRYEYGGLNHRFPNGIILRFR